ncbi:MAG: rhomboid family intramembrane serine protease [Solirubrobacterales bacterium]
MGSTTSTSEFREDPPQQFCYRHPNRETNVACSSCGKPICPDCMTPSPVGMRCPDCAGERTRVITAAQVGDQSAVAALWREAPLTTILIAINLVAFIAELVSGYPLSPFPSNVQGDVLLHGVFFGPAIADGEWWRVITSGFLHFGLIHIGFNMYLLYVLGKMLEPEIGSVRYGIVYLSALLAGSLGSIILEPGTPSAGASGAIFGLMGLAIVIARARGLNDAVKQIGVLIGINLLITFGYSGISKGAHLGGLLGGALAGVVLFELDERRHVFGRNKWAGTLIIALFAIGLFAANIVIARHQYPAIAAGTV